MSETTQRGLTRFEWASIGVALTAIILRIPFITTPRIIWDSAWYLLLARSFGETGTFYLPWSDPAIPQYSGYWPPLYPWWLTPLVKTLGASYHTLALGSILATILLALIVLYTTTDLFGRTRGFAAMALVAASPAFIASNSTGMSEPLLAAMVTLTVWAYLKSIRETKWLILAGVFALLAYLAKASLGLPFVLLGVAVLAAFRIRSRGLRAVIRSPIDIGVLAAGLATAAIMAATRTEKFGGIGLGFIEPLKLVVGQPLWVPVFVFKVFFASVFLLAITLPLSLKLKHAWNDRRQEMVGTLWLAAVVPLVLGAVFTATFFLTEGRELIDFDNIRYLTPAIVPFIWLVIPYYDFTALESTAKIKDKRIAHRHLLAYAAAVGALFALFLVNPNAPAQTFLRFTLFLMMSALPLGLAAYVLTTHYKHAKRTTAEGEDTRLVASPARNAGGGAMVGVFAIGVLLAWFVSATYGYFAIALAVARVSMSPRWRVLAVALLFLAATVPSARTVFPVEEASEEIAAMFPDGTMLGLDERAVYFAAVAPANMELRMIGFNAGEVPPDEIDALVIVNRPVEEPANFTLVKRWLYGIDLYPTLELTVGIERALTGDSPTLCPSPALSLYARDGSPQAQAAQAAPWTPPSAPDYCPDAFS